jgi:hypothetical protein
MKKFSVLIALVLLAVAGTGYAVTCAYDNVPAATLLVPYWKVSMNQVNPALPSTPMTDTLVGIVNVSAPGIIAHVTVWNKYSRAVLDFNVPLTGKDVAYFKMSQILNGNLNVNGNEQTIPAISPDPCGIDLSVPATPVYAPSIGWGGGQFIRFSNPEANQAVNRTGDAWASISQYANPAYPGFQARVWDSLDESGDITFDNATTNIIDTDNPACLKPSTALGASDGVFSGNFSGYLTIDVVNFCTNFFPSDPQTYTYDAIATAGWGTGSNTDGRLTYTPNVLIGDVFFIDNAAAAGNISGDQAVPLEFDSRLFSNTGVKTFYGKYVNSVVPADCNNAQTEKNGVPCAFYDWYAPNFQFAGDGREPLGDRYGFRYFANPASGLQTWITVWRSDAYPASAIGTGTPAVASNDLCSWLNASAVNKANTGFNDPAHQLVAAVYDDDERSNQTSGCGGPSGCQPGPASVPYVYLETQRIDLSTGAHAFNPAGYVGGWADLQFRGTGTNPASAALLQNQAWVGVEHTSPGAFVSVGYAAANLNNQFNCIPTTVPFAVPGNTP